jgi:hypothetical protein
MATLLNLAAGVFDLYFGFIDTLTAACFFALSGTFRRQAYERWARQGQLKTAAEISRGLLALSTAAALLATTAFAVTRFI